MATLIMPPAASAHDPRVSVTTAGSAPPGDTATDAPANTSTTTVSRAAILADERASDVRVNRVGVTEYFLGPGRRTRGGHRQRTRCTTGSAAAVLDG